LPSPNFNELEEGTELKLQFDKLKSVAKLAENTLPAIAQDINSKEVLIVGYVNQQALDYSLVHKVATFWSTSRNELWVKGASSGDLLTLIEVRVNCEQNAILYLVEPKTQSACHTKNKQGKSRKSCFYRSIISNGSLAFLEP